MTQPLALVFYEKLLPGTQLVNRLQDMGYRLSTASSAEFLLTSATQEKPMLVFADLSARKSKIVEAIAHLRQNPETSHLPIICFAAETDAAVQTAASAAGATIVTTETAIMTHLQQFLEQALRLD